jgi:hypothetical protein
MPYGDFSGYWFAISRLLIPPFQTFIPLLMNDAADYNSVNGYELISTFYVRAVVLINP